MLNADNTRKGHGFPDEMIKLIHECWDKLSIPVASKHNIKNPENKDEEHAQYIQILTNSEVYLATINNKNIVEQFKKLWGSVPSESSFIHHKPYYIKYDTKYYHFFQCRLCRNGKLMFQGLIDTIKGYCKCTTSACVNFRCTCGNFVANIDDLTDEQRENLKECFCKCNCYECAGCRVNGDYSFQSLIMEAYERMELNKDDTKYFQYPYVTIFDVNILTIIINSVYFYALRDIHRMHVC